MRPFQPILAGATLRDRVLACLGAAVGIAITGLAGRFLLPQAPGLVLMLAPPMGASAVLLFAVPASPLAQPWPVIGGSTLSALTGIAVHHIIPDPMLGGGLAVGLAIAVMSLARCLHAPGGAVALIGVIGGPAVAALDWRFAATPVLINAVVLTTVGWLFHRFSGHTYPHRPAPPQPSGVSQADIDAALAAYGEPLDVSRSDLKAVFDLAEAASRDRGGRRP